MIHHPAFVRLHILLIGFWLANLAAYPIFKREIKRNDNSISEKTYVILHIIFFNILGSLTAIGIILLDILKSNLNFDQDVFTLLADQLLYLKLILLIAVFVLFIIFLIPKAKNTIVSLEKEKRVNDSVRFSFNKANKISLYINIIVIINLLFTLSE